jgi:hypothetical protein
MRIKWALAAGSAGMLLFLTVMTACGSNNTTPTGTTTTTGGVSLKNSIQPIFNDKCVACHQGASSISPGGLSLEPNVAYSNLVNVKSTESALMRVSPGAPDKSYLIDKLKGTQSQAGGSGAQMPFGASPLPQAQIDLISQWISAGAPNN